MNQYVRDSFNYLRSNATASVATNETTTSTTYTDLTTVGPAVTVTTDVQAIVLIYCGMGNSATPNVTYMGYAVSGATTIAAADTSASDIQCTAGNAAQWKGSSTFLITGLTAGSNTFTCKYRVNGGTGSFFDRKITVIPC